MQLLWYCLRYFLVIYFNLFKYCSSEKGKFVIVFITLDLSKGLVMGGSCFGLTFYQYVFMRYFYFVVYNFMEHLQSNFYSAFLQSWPTESMHHICDTAGVVLSVAWHNMLLIFGFFPNCIYFLMYKDSILCSKDLYTIQILVCSTIQDLV